MFFDCASGWSQQLSWSCPPILSVTKLLYVVAWRSFARCREVSPFIVEFLSLLSSFTSCCGISPVIVEFHPLLWSFTRCCRGSPIVAEFHHLLWHFAYSFLQIAWIFSLYLKVQSLSVWLVELRKPKKKLMFSDVKIVLRRSFFS